MKKRYIVIFSLVFLLIPTYIVLSILIRESDIPINLRSLRTVEMISPNGAEYTFNADEEDGIADLFLEMIMEKRSVAYPGDKVDVDRCFKVKFITDLFNTDYDFIFTSDPSECFVRQTEGVKVSYYRILTSQAKKFLSTEYSEGVYAGSKIPTLVISGEEIGVSKVTWNYKTVSGQVKEAKEYEISSDRTTIGAVATDFVCDFSTKPDNIDVKISREDTGETLYIGKYTNIGKISATENHYVKIEIYANWAESVSKDYWGNITYVVYAKLHAPASFYLNVPQIKEGEFVIINAKNLIDAQGLSCVCEDLEITPMFFKDGEYYRAYVPIPIGTLDSLEDGKNKISFKLKSVDSEQTLELLILERSDNAKTVYNIEQKAFVETNICSNPYSVIYPKIESAVRNVTDFSKNYATGRFFDGYKGIARRTSFGTHIQYSGVMGVFRGTDSHYVGAAKDQITSVNAGKIVFIGSFDYTGGLVVVDHGFGLMSWYWNIGKYAEDIKVGDVVEGGRLLGYNGGGGLTETISGRKASVHIGITVFGQPVDIAPLTRNGIQITDK